MANETDVRLVDIPGYVEWSNKKLESGGSADVIANLDSICMWLAPEEVGSIPPSEFDEIYQEVLEEIGGQ